MFVDDDLIENLRKALDAHVRTASYLELLSAASEIVNLPRDAEPTAVVDRDDEVWTRQPDGHWCLTRECDYTLSMQLASGHGKTLAFITKTYGPTKPYNREG